MPKTIIEMHKLIIPVRERVKKTDVAVNMAPKPINR